MTSVDQPALEDDVTARLFELSVQRVRGTAFWPVTFLAGVGFAVWMWDSAPVVGLAILAAGLVATWQFLNQNVPGSSGWPRAAWREETLWVAPGGVVGFLDFPVAAFVQVKPEN